MVKKKNLILKSSVCPAGSQTSLLPYKNTGTGMKTIQKNPFGFEEFLTCIDNMDSSDVSELNIIQESSDAAAKDLDRPMY